MRSNFQKSCHNNVEFYLIKLSLGFFPNPLEDTVSKKANSTIGVFIEPNQISLM